MFRFAGVKVDSPYVHSVQAFADQALEWEALRESRWNRILQWMLSKQSTHPMLAVRVREIQAWSATPGFASLAAVAAESRNALRCKTCGHRIAADWRHCQECGSLLVAAPPAPAAIPAVPPTRAGETIMMQRPGT
jgi:hypothetical protein